MSRVPSLFANHLLNKFFGFQHGQPTSEQVIMDEMIEKIIQGTDPKIRWVSNYRQQLLPAVAKSLRFIEQVVAQIPGSVEVSSRNFIADPRVHAFFPTTDELHEAFQQSSELQDFVHAHADQGLDHCCTLLCMQKQEKPHLGADLFGDILRRDVLQTRVSFSDHHVLSPAEDETTARIGLRQCMLDNLITFALEHVMQPRVRRKQLSARKTQLQAKLRQCPEDAGVRQELADLDQDLTALNQMADGPRERLERVLSVFSHPEHFIQVQPIALRISSLGMKLDEDDPRPGQRIELAEVAMGNTMKRVVVLADFPLAELRPRMDFLQRASQLLAV